MIVPVYTDGQKLEYFTIELQGQLEPTHGDVLDGLRIGALRVEHVRIAAAFGEVFQIRGHRSALHALLVHRAFLT